MIRAYDDYGNVYDLVEHDREVYNKAINDFTEKIKKRRQYFKECCQNDYAAIAEANAYLEIAEQLKEGGKE